METARQVIRHIRDGIFWPPADPPNYPDGLIFLCGDTLAERREIIGNSSQFHTAPSGGQP
jgi:hypothetical protein